MNQRLDKPQLKSEKSTRVQVKEDNVEGETLAFCSDSEWEQSESAYSADLLNVKNKSVSLSLKIRLFRIG